MANTITIKGAPITTLTSICGCFNTARSKYYCNETI